MLVMFVSNDGMRRNEDLYSFLLVYYVYLSIFTLAIGARGIRSTSEDSNLAVTFSKFRLSGSLYDSYLQTTLPLWQLVAQIATFFAEMTSAEAQGHPSPSVAEKHQMFKASIQDFDAGVFTSESQILAAKLLQCAVLTLLHVLFYGHRSMESLPCEEEIEACIAYFLELASLAPRGWPLGHTVTWPCIVIGSCIRNKAQQVSLVKLMGEDGLNLCFAKSIVRLLETIWNDEDERSFGVVGIWRALKIHKVSAGLS